MGSMSSGDKELGVDDHLFARYEIRLGQRVHVVNQQTMVNIVTRDPEVTALIARNDFAASELPLSRPVERLIHPPVKTKGLLSDKPS